MELLLILLLIIAVAAIVWYMRDQNAKDAERRRVEEQRRLQAQAEADRAAAAAAVAAGAESARAAASSGGLLQDAADAAAGLRYEAATDRMDTMTADLTEARRDAERAAERLAGQADEALASVQAAASAHGSAVPGDGTRDCPANYPIKGNMPSMLYHEPGQATYARTIPEVCFQNSAAAEAAGFSSARTASGLAGVAGMVEEMLTEELVVEVDEERTPVGVVADAVAAAEAGTVPPGAIRGDGSRDCPPAYPVKGNTDSMLYHLPDSPWYRLTRPELCFSNVAAATAAGYAPATSPYGSVPGDGTHECPADHPVKGNADSGLYHEPGSPAYALTIPEFCFTSVAAAAAAGFSPPQG